MKTNPSASHPHLLAGLPHLKRLAAATLLAAALFGASFEVRGAGATPPELMAYQGYLVDANGDPLAPSNPLNYPVIFRIYTASSGGDLLWSEQQIVTVDKGNFGVLLGQGSVYASEDRPDLSTVMGGEFASELFVGITVTIDGNSQEILPRIRLMTSPYAFLATRASSLVQPDGTPVISYSGGQIQLTGGVNIGGTVSGDGSGLTGLTEAQIPNLNAAKITAGTIPNDRIPADLGARTFSGGINANGNTYVNGGNFHMDNARVFLGKNLAGTYENFLWPRWSDNVTYLNYGGGGFNVRNNNSTSTMFMEHGGRVGMGTTGPADQLHVQSTSSMRVRAETSSSGYAGFLSKNSLGEWFAGVEGATSYWQVYQNAPSPGARLVITSGGNVGIGTTAPAFKLHVIGQGFATAGFFPLSDRRMKRDFAELADPLKKVMAIRGVSYDWRGDEFPEQDFPSARQIGFVAQEVGAVLPEVVVEGEDGYQAVNYDAMVAVLVEAIKEQQRDLEKKTSTIGDLDARVAELEARLAEQRTTTARWEARFERLEKSLAAQSAIEALNDREPTAVAAR